MMRRLRDLLDELEMDRSLEDPDRLRQRIEALDRLDAYLLDGQLPALGELSLATENLRRARALYTRLEAANCSLYQEIRLEIQRGDGPGSLLHWLPSRTERSGDNAVLATGQGYDYLDELISGVMQFSTPEAGGAPLAPGMVFYQPTPARHIFDMLAQTALTEEDVLIDLGSGLGHVPLLVSICTPARGIGIELQTAYVDCARYAAKELNLNRVTFIQQDVRAADLSRGTVFYLYTPFTWSILRAVLDRLLQEGDKREIRICTFGPCTPAVGEEPWLQALDASDEDRIAVFSSRG